MDNVEVAFIRVLDLLIDTNIRDIEMTSTWMWLNTKFLKAILAS